MRCLITGISGFAGGHLTAELLKRGAAVAGLDQVAGNQLEPFADRILFAQGDIRDADAVRGLAAEFRPDTILHLAAITHVAQAWERRRATLEINVIGTAAVLEVAAELDPKPTVVLASSGQVYGAAPADSAPLTEDAPLDPEGPYAVSKLCCELLARQAWTGEGVPTISLRTFNYTGPWQAPTFVCSDFARQVARVEAGLDPPEMTVGDLEAKRDFSDVRDVVDAFLLAAERGRPGRAYNIASGNAVSIRVILEHLRSAVDIEIDVRQDPERLRKIDPSTLRGDASRARDELGWRPRYSLEDTLDSVLDFWRRQIAEER